MKLLWSFLLILSVLLLSNVSNGFDDDEDDDGVVEDIPDENIVREKPKYEPPKVSGSTYFTEPFNSQTAYKKKWTNSQAKKDGTDESIAKYDGQWSVEEPKDAGLEGDLALILKTKAKHHAISAKMDKPFEFKGKPFIVSYEVKFQNGLDCGGAYVKLLSKSDKVELSNFHDKTPYTVMFGPDKCGMDHKLHFIFRHKNPKTGEFEEKHAKKPSGSLDSYFTDKKTHLYTLVINPDNSFEVLVDNKVVNSGSLLEDMSPPVNPPKEIDDPHDKRPADWDDKEKIPDPDATKPDDWDENEPEEIVDEDAEKPDGWLDDEENLIPDPDAEKPDDWDEEMDGEWEAPLIDNPACKDAPGCGAWTKPTIKNPKYKGKWKAPMIDNPDYQGIWKPRRISNPDWFEDLEPYKMTPIHALGLELWSMTDHIIFDNFLVTDDKEVHSSWVAQTWEKKTTAETYSSGGQGIWSALMSAAEQRPWLWAVYCVVCLLPIVLLSICLCPRSGPVKPEDLDAARKKTDEASPDDQEVEGEEKKAEGEDQIDVGPTGDNKKTKKSKAALEEQEDQKEGTEEEDEEEEEEETKEEAKDNEEANTDSPRRSPRKRKTRKD